MIRSAAFMEAVKRLSLSVVMLEIGIITLSVVCFVILNLYVLGCEKV